MPLLPYFALLLALAGSPLLLALFKRLHFTPFSPVARALLWATSGVVLAIAAAAGGGWLAYSGVAWPTWPDLGLATLAAAATFTAFGLSQHVQRMLGTSSPKQMEQYANIIRLSYSHRVFLVVTAAVAEEVLYRGYAIGVSQHLLGSVWLAGVVSVAAFTLAHLRWGACPPVSCIHQRADFDAAVRFHAQSFGVCHCACHSRRGWLPCSACHRGTQAIKAAAERRIARRLGKPPLLGRTVRQERPVDIKKLFEDKSDIYARARPRYPAALFE